MNITEENTVLIEEGKPEGQNLIYEG